MSASEQVRRKRPRRGRGFAPAGGFVQGDIRRAGENRGFSETRLILRWPEIVGDEIASFCRPVRVAWGRGGLGATLTLLTRGGAAPMLQARLPVIRDRVNACYGYNAIARIRLTQTAPIGFADAPANYHVSACDSEPEAFPPDAEIASHVSGIRDGDLRTALAALGSRIRKKFCK